jgi:hypothetical protein
MQSQIYIRDDNMESTEKEANVDSLHSKDKKNKRKESPDESEFKINMNPWGLTFMILFVALLGYILIGAMASIPPFTYNVLTEEYDIMEGLLTAIIVGALLCLGLGIYFGYMKKPKETEDEPEEIVGIEEAEIANKASARQITFVYADDEKSEE